MLDDLGLRATLKVKSRSIALPMQPSIPRASDAVTTLPTSARRTSSSLARNRKQLKNLLGNTLQCLPRVSSLCNHTAL